MSGTVYAAFAAVVPGLEPLLAAEVAELLPEAAPRTVKGGVEVRVPREGLWTLATRSRLAESLRVRAGSFRARTFAELEEGLARVPWAAYLPRGSAPTVHVSCRKSALYHSGAVEGRVTAHLAARLGRPAGRLPDARPEPAGRLPDAAPAVFLRLDHDHVTVSLDASGELLHRRGWRPTAVEAPLRETLAAACVRAAGLAPGAALWDPFCGTGTLVIEAAAARAGLAANASRSFAFEAWPTHDAGAWARFRESLPGDDRESSGDPSGGPDRGAPGAHAAGGPAFLGSDADLRAVALAVRSADQAGVAAACRFVAGDFQAVLPHVPAGAAVLTNVPWGRRLGAPARLRDTWSRFGEALASRPDLAPVHVLSGARDYSRSTGLPWERVLTFRAGGVPVELLRLRR